MSLLSPIKPRKKIKYRVWNEDTDEEGNKFLDAIYHGFLHIIEDCIKRGVDPNLTFNDEDLTPLHRAAILGDVAMGKILLKSPRIEVDATDPAGLTALMFACIYRNENFVKLLLKRGAKPNLVNMKKQTPLHMACISNSMKIANHLIANGAPINVLDVFDNTPLSISVIDQASMPLSAMLLKKGANATSVKQFPLFLECVLNCNTTARLQIVKLLLDHCDIYCLHPISKRNCLHYVAITGYLPAAKVLLKRGQANLYVSDLAGRTPLNIAWDHRNLEVYHHYIDCFEINELKETLEDDILKCLYKLFDEKGH